MTYKIIYSLLIFFFGLLLVWDPLHWVPDAHKRKINTLGYLLLLASIALSLSFVSFFPVWLWLVPVVFLITPYLAPSLKQHKKTLMSLAVMTTLIYFVIIGLQIYSDFKTDHKTDHKSAKTLPSPPTPKPEPVPPPDKPAEIKSPTGPLANAIQEIDTEIKRLKESHSSLEKENLELKVKLENAIQEKAILEAEIKARDKKIQQLKEKISKAKDTVEGL